MWILNPGDRTGVCVESPDWRRGPGAARGWLRGQRGVSTGEAQTQGSDRSRESEISHWTDIVFLMTN